MTTTTHQSAATNQYAQEDLMSTWRRSMYGDSDARQAFIQRISRPNEQFVMPMLAPSAAAPNEAIAPTVEQEAQEDIIALWRRSMYGDSDARQMFIERISRAEAQAAQATILVFAEPRRHPNREAA